MANVTTTGVASGWVFDTPSQQWVGPHGQVLPMGISPFPSTTQAPNTVWGTPIGGSLPGAGSQWGSIGTLPIPIHHPEPPKSKEYWEKVAQDLAKIASEEHARSKQLRAERDLMQGDAKKYQDLLVWLVTCHPEIVEEHSVFLKTKERLGVEE